jgi:hypothetical protein
MYQGYHRKSCWYELSQLPFYRAVRLAGRLRLTLSNYTIIKNYKKVSNKEKMKHTTTTNGRTAQKHVDDDSDLTMTSSGTNKLAITPTGVKVHDIDAVSIVPQLQSSDFQVAVGEFGAMLAVRALGVDNIPPFVGFTSWRESVKANWKEGASIDWTKVDFKENTIYYWYSIYEGKNRSYYQVMDAEHSGMSVVMKDLVDFPLPTMTDQNYVYAHYFITTKEVFLEYMEDALKFVDRFFTKFPINSKCPFGLPEDTSFPNKRCIGYILERYFNVWVAYKKLRLVYAVDHPEWRRS